MEKLVKKTADLFLEKSKNKRIKILTHHDTDGITSGAIIVRTLKELERNFKIKVIKNLEKKHIKETGEILLLLDLGSSSLKDLNKLEDVFVIDHHEIDGEAGDVNFINPHLFNNEPISAAGLTYLFSKELIGKKRELATLAVVGMVGDMLDRDVGKLNKKIINDANIEIKQGLMLYPATRPLNKTLQYSSSIYIPGVTGDSEGVFNLLREVGIKKQGSSYKSLVDLDEDETSKLLTAILLRTKKQDKDLIGNIYLINFFNRKKDARELSAMINACSRLGHRGLSLCLCLKNEKAKQKAEEIYTNYKQKIVSSLKYAEKNIEEKDNYAILNAKDNIKDTIIGTVASILSMSKKFKDGKIIVTTAYDNDKLKVSARISGRDGRDVREILEKAMEGIEGDFGGHKAAAGCLIPKNKEEEFLKNLKETLKLEVVKV